MHSYQAIAESYDTLMAVLRPMLPSGHRLTVTDTDKYPLLVMEARDDAAGFAVVNGSPVADFQLAYGAYKALYRARHDQWSRRHLSFVLLRSEPSLEHDSFFARIEADPFFCRKYVIRFEADAAKLNQELLRLPFVPLPLGGLPGPSRPPSAQSLLQGLGVSAALARNIVVPRQASASHLLESVSTSRDLPALVTSENVLPGEPAGPVGRSRLRSVSVEGFRAFNKRQVFDLDADVVVLYGPNGLGKTSLFDSIDYACTGRIGRLCRGRISKSKFVEFARHLGTGADRAEVRVELTRDGKHHSLVRRVDDWGNAVLSGDSLNRPKTLEFLTSAEWGPARARIENLERLFRATHFFDQSTPELFLTFERESLLSADLVARTLALDDYASGMDKTEEVLGLLRKRLAEAAQRGKALEQRIAKITEERKAIPETEDALEPGEQLQRIAATLADDLRAIVDVPVIEGDLKPSVPRDWRALVEGALKKTQMRLSHLKDLETDFTSYEESRDRLPSVEDAEKAGEAALKLARAQRTDLDERVRSLEARREEIEARLAEARNQSEALHELAKLQSSSNEVTANVATLRAARAEVEARSANGVEERQSVLSQLEQLRQKRGEEQDRCARSAKMAAALQELRTGTERWRSNLEEAEDLQNQIRSVEATLTETRGELTERQHRMDKLTEEFAVRDEEYQALAASHSKLTRLLDQLETHVVSATCPACGTDHDTKTALIRRIRAQKDSRPSRVDELAEQRRELRDVLSVVKTEATRLMAQQDADKRRLTELEERLAALQARIAEYAESLHAHGIAAEVQSVEDTVDKLLEKRLVEVRLSRVSLEELAGEQARCEAKLEELELRAEEETSKSERISRRIGILEERLQEMVVRAKELGWPLDLAPDTVKAEEKLSVERYADCQVQLDALTDEVKAAKEARDQAEISYRDAKAAQAKLVAEREMLREAVARFEAAAADAGLVGPPARELIAREGVASAERAETLRSLARRALALEGALDAATRSARVAELDQELAQLTADNDSVEREREHLARTSAWFSRVKDVLSQARSEGVANHVRAFGPLTTLLQRRLRPVYGFGDVSLRAKGNQIGVFVDRDGKSLKPTDFFSDSQKQILILSLFLATRLTQSWSGFAPILLDDPVTHFDDLNAFAFVEMMRGLVNLVPGELQFIVSTCEERLFDLMRDKLGGGERGAKFYRFEGIDADGPIVSMIGS